MQYRLLVIIYYRLNEYRKSFTAIICISIVVNGLLISDIVIGYTILDIVIGYRMLSIIIVDSTSDISYRISGILIGCSISDHVIGYST